MYDYELMQRQMEMQNQACYDTMMMSAMQAERARYETVQNAAMMNQHQYGGMKMRKPTKKDILEYMRQSLSAGEIVGVDEFETMRTRHICNGSKEIQVLDIGVFPVNTGYSCFNIEYFLCPHCRKLIYNKCSMAV